MLVKGLCMLPLGTKTDPYILNDVTVTALKLLCFLLGWMLFNTSSRGRLSANKTLLHRPSLLLRCLTDIYFLCGLFLPSCSVGAVCPCARRGNIIHMSVIPYQLAQSFLKKFWHFSKIFFHIVFRWFCLNCRLHHLTLPPQYPVILLCFINIRKPCPYPYLTEHK